MRQETEGEGGAGRRERVACPQCGQAMRRKAGREGSIVEPAARQSAAGNGSGSRETSDENWMSRDFHDTNRDVNVLDDAEKPGDADATPALPVTCPGAPGVSRYAAELAGKRVKCAKCATRSRSQTAARTPAHATGLEVAEAADEPVAMPAAAHRMQRHGSSTRRWRSSRRWSMDAPSTPACIPIRTGTSAGILQHRQVAHQRRRLREPLRGEDRADRMDAADPAIDAPRRAHLALRRRT